MRRAIVASALVVSGVFAAAARAAQPGEPAAEPAAPAPESAAPAPESATSAAQPAAAPPASSTKEKASVAAPPPPPVMVTARPAPATPVVVPLPAGAASPRADAGARPHLPRGPIESRFNVRLDLDVVWNKSSSFDIVSDRDTSVFPGIAIGYAVLRAERLALIPELGFAGNHSDGSAVFGGAVSSTSLTTLNPYAGLSARWAVLSVLDLAARISGGASFVSFDMDTADGEPRLSDDHVAPFFTAGGGFTLRSWDSAFETNSGTLRSLVMGLGVEGGYLFAGSVDLTPTASTGARIRTEYMSLGTLERSGPYLKTSLTARF